MYATLLTLSVAALSVADSIGVGRKFYSNPTRKFPSRQPPPLIWSPIPRISECVYSFSKPRAAFLAASSGGTDCPCPPSSQLLTVATTVHLHGRQQRWHRLDCPSSSQHQWVRLHHCSGQLRLQIFAFKVPYSGRIWVVYLNRNVSYNYLLSMLSIISFLR